MDIKIFLCAFSYSRFTIEIFLPSQFYKDIILLVLLSVEGYLTREISKYQQKNFNFILEACVWFLEFVSILSEVMSFKSFNGVIKGGIVEEGIFLFGYNWFLLFGTQGCIFGDASSNHGLLLKLIVVLPKIEGVYPGLNPNNQKWGRGVLMGVPKKTPYLLILNTKRYLTI